MVWLPLTWIDEIRKNLKKKKWRKKSSSSPNKWAFIRTKFSTKNHKIILKSPKFLSVLLNQIYLQDLEHNTYAVLQKQCLHAALLADLKRKSHETLKDENVIVLLQGIVTIAVVVVIGKLNMGQEWRDTCYMPLKQWVTKFLHPYKVIIQGVINWVSCNKHIYECNHL